MCRNHSSFYLCAHVYVSFIEPLNFLFTREEPLNPIVKAHPALVVQVNIREGWLAGWLYWITHLTEYSVVCVCVCVCVYVYVCVFLCVYLCVCAYVYACARIWYVGMKRCSLHLGTLCSTSQCEVRPWRQKAVAKRWVVLPYQSSVLHFKIT